MLLFAWPLLLLSAFGSGAALRLPQPPLPLPLLVPLLLSLLALLVVRSRATMQTRASLRQALPGFLGQKVATACVWVLAWVPGSDLLSLRPGLTISFARLAELATYTAPKPSSAAYKHYSQAPPPTEEEAFSWEQEQEYLRLLQYLPEWTKVPGVHRVKWANKLLTAAWPSVRAASERTVSAQLQAQLDYNRPVWLSDIRVEYLSLGQTAPLLAHVTTHTQTHSQAVVLDCGVSIANEAVAILRLTTRGWPKVSVRVRVDSIAADLTVRLGLGHLIPSWPCFAGVSVSLVQQPKLAFDLWLLLGAAGATTARYGSEDKKRTANKTGSWSSHLPALPLTALPGVGWLAQRWLTDLIRLYVLWPR